MRRSVFIVALLVAAVIVSPLASACGGDSDSGPPGTGTPGLTPEVTSSPASATSTPDETGVSRTAVPPVPATEIGRSDCPAGWLGYQETAFSICYPPDYYTHVWSTADTGPWFTVRLIPGDPVAFTSNNLSVMAVQEYAPPTECLFEAEEVFEPDSAAIEPYASASAEGVACAAELSGTAQFRGALRAPPGGIDFRIQAATDEQLDLGKEILETVRPR